MTREQAARIHDHLFDAWDAMNQARMQIAGLGKIERLKFDELLKEVVHDLQDKLLLQIWEQFPDLMPPDTNENPSEVGSYLTWKEVTLPPSVTENQLDEIILSVLKSRWQKTTVVLTRAGESCEKLGLPVNHEVIAARLRELSDADRIEGVGDLRI